MVSEIETATEHATGESRLMWARMPERINSSNFNQVRTMVVKIKAASYRATANI